MTPYVMQLMWHLNNECNLSCIHCYNNKQKSRPVNRLDFQKFVIRRISDLQKYYRIIRVGLLGGEPLLDPNIIALINLLHENGIQRIDISTNGSLINRRLAQDLKNAAVGMIQVSIEGSTPAINDVIRGKDAFKKAIRGLRLLVKTEINVGIMTTISRFNLPHIEAIVELALREGVKIISFNRMLPLGQGKSNKLFTLLSSELHSMMSLIHRLREKYRGTIDISSDDPLLYVPMSDRQSIITAYGGCGAGIGNLAINYDGVIFPCRRLPIEIGNIANDSFIDIINSSRLDCFYDRGVLKGDCGICDHRQICGGCRAAAYSFTGDYLNQDPQCWKIPQKGGS